MAHYIIIDYTNRLILTEGTAQEFKQFLASNFVNSSDLVFMEISDNTALIGISKLKPIPLKDLIKLEEAEFYQRIIKQKGLNAIPLKEALGKN